MEEMEEMEEQALQYNQLRGLCEFLCVKQHETSYSQAAYAMALGQY